MLVQLYENVINKNRNHALILFKWWIGFCTFRVPDKVHRAGVAISEHLSNFCKCSEIAGAYVKFDQQTCFSNLNLSFGCHYELYTCTSLEMVCLKV